MSFFEEKPILLLSTSPGRGGGRRAIVHAEQILSNYLKGTVVGKFSLPAFKHNLAVNGVIAGFENKELEQELGELIGKFEEALAE